MAMRKRVVQVVGVAAGVVGGVAAAFPDSAVGRAARRLGGRLARDVRYAAASAPGIVYRLAGSRPDPDVADDVLADRIRSTLGPLEKRLDIPRVHVMVEDHIALLHGDVADERDAVAIERCVFGVSGVRGVESHLHTGLIRGDTRPSEGAVAQPSHALRALLDAARDAGSDQPTAAVHAVLCGFSERIPESEWNQVFAHLPADVRAVAGPVRRHGERPPRLRTVPQLVAAVTAVGGIPAAVADDITRAVITSLRTLVPDEARDVAAVLPGELRELWDSEPAR